MGAVEDEGVIRKAVINMVAFGGVGAILANAGVGYTVWELWGVLLALVVVQVNNSV